MKIDRNVVIINKIEEYCIQIHETTMFFKNSKEEFERNFIFQNACNMCVLQIGELAKNLDKEFRNKHDQVPWRQIAGMRDIFAHNYTQVDTSEAWDTIQNDIPVLQEYCRQILQELKESKG